MAKSSCLLIKPTYRFAELRHERLIICGYDRCAAMLMGLMAFWTDYRLEENEKAEPWFFLSKKRMREGLLGVFGEPSIERGLAILEKAGLLKVREADQVCGPKWYLFNYRLANEMISRLPDKGEEIPESPRCPNRRKGWEASPFGNVALGNNAEGENDPLGNVAQDASAMLPKDASAMLPTSSTSYSRTTLSSTTRENGKNRDEEEESSHAPGPHGPENPPTTAASPEPEVSPHVQPLDTTELYLADPVEQFCHDAYRRSGRKWKKLNKSDRNPGGLLQQLQESEEKHGPEDFRAGLLLYLSETSDWLKENQWPIRGYLKNPEKYFRERYAAPNSEAGEPATRFSDPARAISPPQTVLGLPIENSKGEKLTAEGFVPAPPGRTPQMAFDQIWNLYPKHRRDKKPLCYRLWLERINRIAIERFDRNRGDALTMMLESLENKWIPSQRWKDGFVCNLSSWIENERWLEDPEPAEPEDSDDQYEEARA